MARRATPTWFFAVVIARDSRGRFLLVHERKHGGGWYFPAGRVEPGETLAQAAVRETREEAGIDVELTGIYRIEHSVISSGARMRVLYGARPADDTPPKSQPDEDTLGAAWVDLAELDRLPLRGAEVRYVLQEIAQGAPLYPMTLITPEGAPLL